MENKIDSGESGRRRFVGKLVALTAGLGITGALLSQEKTGLLPVAHAATQSYTDAGSPVLSATNTAAGVAVEGNSNGSNGIGVGGISDYGIGVCGASSSGIGVAAESAGPGGIPIVVQGCSTFLGGQTANLQEWRNGGEQTLAVVDASGRLGIGAGSPVSAFQAVRPASWANADPLIRLDGDTYNVGAFFYAYGTGNFPFFSGRRSRGSQASPSAVQSGDLLMRYGGAGYGTSAFPSGNRAMIDFYAAENWTNTAQGTYVTISTTTTGASAPTEKVRVTGDGSILPPSDNTGSIGKVGQRWSLVRAQTITSGDLTFENGYRLTEDSDSGMLLVNEDGERIARFDHDGNLHIKGRLIQEA